MVKITTWHGKWKIVCSEDGKCKAMLGSVTLKGCSLSDVRAAIEDHEKKKREAEERFNELRQDRSDELKP